MNSKRKAVVAALGATAVGAVVMTGASSAYFHDTEEINGNKIGAGSLDLKYTITGTAVQDGRIVLENVKPQELADFTIKVTNVGSVEGRVSAKVSDVVNAENEIWEPEAEYGDESQSDGELSDKMRVNVGKYLSELNSVGLADIGGLVHKELSRAPLKAGTSKEVTFQVFLPNRYSDAAANNTVMSDSYSFDLDLALSQK